MRFAAAQSCDVFWHGLNLRWVYSDLFRNIFSHTKCKQLAGDLLHDSLLSYAISKNITTIDEPHAYLRVIVRNLLQDNFKNQARFVSLSDEENGAHALLESPEFWVPSAEILVELRQKLENLQRIIDCLPPKCRNVFLQYRIEGKSHAEIAASLNISVNMVERHMMRALVDISAARDYLI
jgi:RNA polymerase sigma factor (sigma-70 family)